MELNIKAKNVDVNQKLQGHIERKFGDLIRHLPAITNVNVELSSQATRSQSDRMVAQATLNVDGSLLRAEQRVANAVGTINLVPGSWTGGSSGTRAGPIVAKGPSRSLRWWTNRPRTIP